MGKIILTWNYQITKKYMENAAQNIYNCNDLS